MLSCRSLRLRVAAAARAVTMIVIARRGQTHRGLNLTQVMRLIKLLVKKREKRRMVLLEMSMIKKVVQNLSIILKRDQMTKSVLKRNRPDPDLPQVIHQTNLGDAAGKTMMSMMMTVIDNQIKSKQRQRVTKWVDTTTHSISTLN